MKKEPLSRVSIPGRVLDLLWADDEFFRDVTSHKKASSSGKFPRCDQWCDEAGFHMAFALAGYSPCDVTVCVRHNELYVEGLGSKVDVSSLSTSADADASMGVTVDGDDEYPAKIPKLGVQHGIIVRGIARRNFKTKYFINSSFELSKTKASMKNGLLEVLIPRKEEEISRSIKIEEK